MGEGYLMSDISINIADLTKDNILAVCMIAPITPHKMIKNCEPKNLDGMAIVLECTKEQALAVRDVIRMRYNSHEMRIYEGMKRI
jgi:hypothetical protein